MNAFLKNIPLILLAAFGTASCSFYTAPGGLPVPTTPADMPFPKRAPYNDSTSRYAQQCLKGEYTGEKIGKSTGGKFWVIDFRNLSKIGRPNPDGKGKIYVLYLRDEEEPPPPLSADINAPWGEDTWEYSFTFFTTDEDIVTDCKVTRRLLFRL